MLSWKHGCGVRTTLNLDDDVFQAVSQRAKERGVALGKVISELVRRALETPTPTSEEAGLVVFRLPPDSPRVSSDLVRRLESEGV